jgi:ribosomal protein S18 acetylase RimI-like enzyme
MGDRDRPLQTAATPAEREAAALDLAAAFEADPMLTWFLKPGAGLPRALQGFFRVMGRGFVNLGGEVTRPAAGGGAALWIGSENIGSFRLADDLASMVMILRGCGPARVPRALKVRDAMDANHPHEPAHDYLAFLGVRPEQQGRGIGSRLLAAHTAKLDAAGRPAFLETANERTLSLYQSHGFIVTGAYRPAPESPTMWTLWREPRGEA